MNDSIIQELRKRNPTYSIEFKPSSIEGHVDMFVNCHYVTHGRDGLAYFTEKGILDRVLSGIEEEMNEVLFRVWLSEYYSSSVVIYDLATLEVSSVQLTDVDLPILKETEDQDRMGNWYSTDTGLAKLKEYFLKSKISN